MAEKKTSIGVRLYYYKLDILIANNLKTRGFWYLPQFLANLADQVESLL